MLVNLAHTPERRHLALLEALAKRREAFGGEISIAISIETAELVLVQTAKDKQ